MSLTTVLQGLFQITLTEALLGLACVLFVLYALNVVGARTPTMQVQKQEGTGNQQVGGSVNTFAPDSKHKGQ